MDIFKSSRTKTSINNFQLSDEEENIRPKKVSFLKSQRNFDSLQSNTLPSDNIQSDSLQSNTLQSCTLRSDNIQSNTLQSNTFQSDIFQSNIVQSVTLQSDIPRTDAFRSDRSLFSHQVRTEVLSRDRYQRDTDLPSHIKSPSLQNNTSKKSLSESSACSRSQLESPLPLYSENSQWESSSERDERDGHTHTSSSRAALSEIHTPSNPSTPTPTSSPPFFQTTRNSRSDALEDCVTVMVNTHSRPLEGGDSTAEQKRQKNLQLIHMLDFRSSASRSGSSRMSRSAPSHSAESRYLGTLKVLEQKLCFQETELETADSLRASVYQIFEKWKQEHDLVLRKQLQKQLQTENKLKEEKEKEKDQRTRDSTFSVTQW
ncbi:hypothetical protein Baya_14769 [Bagarius yarrelli]|uniref:Uncharacterized protein n=1 Tax=Bagarius yarrelli TaxID=175774 RepID=A0A556VB89_BAGYA|nr:hypothetical protein Baya_14769 [Bagarius yarrelli]